MFREDRLPSYFIRIGLAFVFFYAAYSEFIHPELFYHYIPVFIVDYIPKNIFLMVFSIYELLLAVWLLTRFYPRISAACATLTIGMITLFNLQSFDVVFRNISILFSALALFFLDKMTPASQNQPAKVTTMPSAVAPLEKPKPPQSTGQPQNI